MVEVLYSACCRRLVTLNISGGENDRKQGHWPSLIAPETDVLKETKVCLSYSIVSRILNDLLPYNLALEKIFQKMCMPNYVNIARSSLKNQYISIP